MGHLGGFLMQSGLCMSTVKVAIKCKKRSAQKNLPEGKRGGGGDSNFKVKF